MAPEIEAALLTGGASRRMGRDKASLPIDGTPQAVRIATLLAESGIPVTTLGRQVVEGFPFMPDLREFAGPLAALSRFVPQVELVFVASCDLPRFDPRLVRLLRERIGGAEAAVPLVNGFRQPLCALYRATAFAKLAAIEDSCAMAWLDAIDHVIVTEDEIKEARIDPRSTQGANTQEELATLVEIPGSRS